MEGAHAADAHAIRDSESSLPLDDPEIEAARILFAPEDSEVEESKDITKIIQSCLDAVKDVKQHKNQRAIKMLAQLIAVSEYVKLRVRYKSCKTCKQPCLKASIAIARQMVLPLFTSSWLIMYTMDSLNTTITDSPTRLSTS